MANLLPEVFDDCNLAVERYEQAYGGDINDSYCLYTNDGKYFLKLNDAARYPGMFQKEAEGLGVLRQKSSLVVPGVVKTGAIVGKQYLLLTYLEKGHAQQHTQMAFGKALAQMHRQQQEYFGWTEDNYIGSLLQVNTPHDSWSSFYANCRIRHLVKVLYDAHIFQQRDLEMTEALAKKLDELFPQEPPALLHGDLWSGNYMITPSGAAIYDPAVYFGHREMDIGMTLLFGGFDAKFYEGYQEVYPLTPGWRERLPLTQLYPLLVHAVLFRGHYVHSVRDILRRFS